VINLPKRNALVIANPTSGRGACYKVLPDLESEMKKAGWRYSIEIPESEEASLKIAKTSSQKGFDSVIAVGGDGTVHTILQGIDIHNQALGIIPLGSGNDLFRMLKIKGDFESAIKNVIEGENWKIDVGLFGEKRFLNTVGTGIDSETIKVRYETKGFIKRNYVLLFLKTLSQLKPFRMRIIADGKVIEDIFSWVIVANNNYIGGGMMIAPHAKQDDGFLDLIIIRKTSKFRMVQNVPAIFRGDHLKMPEASEMKAEEIIFEGDEKRDLAVDGDIRAQIPIQIRVIPRTLSLIASKL